MRSKIFVVADYHKPVVVPDGDVEGTWPVYNAPRPLPGTKTWQAEFRHGIFYAAVDPNDPCAGEHHRRCKDLDGHLVVHVTNAEVEAYADKLSDELMIDREDHPREEFIRSMVNSLIQADEESFE